MDISTYAVEAEVEGKHWWFVGRRTLFAREIARLGIPGDAKILDVGSSTGTNLRMLRNAGFINVRGLDFSDEAIRWCATKGLPPVEKGDACKIPFPDGSLDLVLATDVIEHIDDDHAALREIARVVKPGGFVLITVPAFQALWGLQDDVAHHKRRYRMPQLLERIGATSLRPIRRYYFNFLLFVPIWCARQLIRATKPKLRSENEINSHLMNATLGMVFHLDIRLAPLIRPPFGVSALVVARKEGGHSA